MSNLEVLDWLVLQSLQLEAVLILWFLLVDHQLCCQSFHVQALCRFFRCCINEPLISISWVYIGNIHQNHTKNWQVHLLWPITCFNYALQLQVILALLVISVNICTYITVLLLQPRLLNLKPNFSAWASVVSNTCLQWYRYIGLAASTNSASAMKYRRPLSHHMVSSWSDMPVSGYKCATDFHSPIADNSSYWRYAIGYFIVAIFATPMNWRPSRFNSSRVVIDAKYELSAMIWTTSEWNHWHKSSLITAVSWVSPFSSDQMLEFSSSSDSTIFILGITLARPSHEWCILKSSTGFWSIAIYWGNPWFIQCPTNPYHFWHWLINTYKFVCREAWWTVFIEVINKIADEWRHLFGMSHF